MLTTTAENLRGNPPKQVVRAGDLKGLIEALHAPSGGCLGPEQVQSIGERLESARKTDEAAWQEHLRRIEAKRAGGDDQFRLGFSRSVARPPSLAAWTDQLMSTAGFSQDDVPWSCRGDPTNPPASSRAALPMYGAWRKGDRFFRQGDAMA